MFGVSAFAQSPFAALGSVAFDLSISEDISLADASTQASAFLQTLAEPIGIADAINDVGGNFFGSVTETISVTDTSTQTSTFLQSRAENIGVASVQTIRAAFRVTRAEAITPRDVQTVYTAMLNSITEAITLNDTPATQFAYSDAITEPVTVDDTPTIAAQFAADIAEAVTLDDVREVAAAFLASVTEDIGVADLIEIVQGFFVAITEDVGVESAQDAFLEFYFNITENLAPADVATVQAVLLMTIAENINMFDSTQIAGWIKIITAQADTWTLVDDGSGQTLPNIRDWTASETNGETTLVIGSPTSGTYYVARKYEQNAWVFSPMPFVIGAYNIANIRWLEDRFYLVGSKTGGAFIATSVDGLTWTEITAPSGSIRILDIARNGNTLVVAATIRVYYSTDSGTSWTSTTRTLSSARPSILWVEELNKFFVVGFNAYSSPDGATWTSVASGGQGTAGYTGIAWSGSELVIAISNSTGTNSRLQRSYDGVTWTIFGAGNNHDVTKVMWDGTQFLFYADGSGSNYNVYTGSGSILTANPNNISGYRVVNSSISYNMVIVDGLYVIPGYQNNSSKHYFYTSTDLVTFSIPEYSGPWVLVADSAPTTWQNVNNFQ